MLYNLEIGGRSVDLTEDIEICLTYTALDADAPEAQHGGYSKSVELPGTETNNNIFGQLYNLDRAILLDAQPNAIGAYFDARKRTEYILWYNGDIVERGYLKVDSVTKEGSDITYSCTLFSDLGDFFYNLMYNSEGDEITLSDLDYGFRDVSGNTVDEESDTLLYWDKDYIIESWKALSGETDGSDRRVQNYITAAPTYGGQYDDFDSDTVLINYASLPTGGTASDLLSPVTTGSAWTRSGYTDYKGWIIGKATREMDEWEVRDIRSVYQRPAIKMSAILDAISNPENNGGFSVEWDDEIKNSPYYQNTYLLLDRLNFDLDEGANALTQIGTSLSSTKCINGIFTYGTMYDADDSSTTVFNLSDYANPHVSVSMNNTLTGSFFFTDINGRNALYTSYRNLFYRGGKLYKSWVYGGLAVRLSAYNGGTVRAETPVYLYSTPIYNSDKEFGYGVDDWRQRIASQLQCGEDDIVLRENTFEWSDTDRAHKWASPILADIALPSEDGLTLYLQIAWVWVSSNINSENGIAAPMINAGKGFMVFPYFEGSVDLLNNDDYSTGFYDGTINPNIQNTKVTKRIIFGETESPYKYLIGFTRMIGAKYRYDLAAKKVYITTRQNYYLPEGHRIDDWVDRSRAIEIQPTLSEFKWYKYGFTTPETYASLLYKRKNKYDYGTAKVDTGYYFNNDEHDVFEGIPYVNGIPFLQNSIYYAVYGGVPSILVSPTLDISTFKESGGTVNSEETKIKGYASFYGVKPMKDVSGSKICAFDAENSAVEDLKDCLVFFDGFTETPVPYQVSDNLPIMQTLNENPCFIYVESGSTAYASDDAADAEFVCGWTDKIPVFSKYRTNANGNYTDSLDFVQPLYTFIGNNANYQNGICLYDRYWRGYIEDLYDPDGKAVTLYLFLKEKPDEAMRKFYLFDNTVWVISEITDYNISSDEPTQVKLIKVYETENYTTNEINWDNKYAKIL